MCEIYKSFKMKDNINKMLLSIAVLAYLIFSVVATLYINIPLIMLATLVNLIAIIIIGVSTAKYIETLIFVTLFMALRGSAGGYHANSHLRCFIGIIVVFGIFIGLLYLKIEILKYMSVVFIILAVVSLLFLSPVGCMNKEIAKKQSAKLRLKLWIMTIVFTIIYVVLICFNVTVIYAFSVSIQCLL